MNVLAQHDSPLCIVEDDDAVKIFALHSVKKMLSVRILFALGVSSLTLGSWISVAICSERDPSRLLVRYASGSNSMS